MSAKLFETVCFSPDILNYRARSILQTATVGSASGFAPYFDAGLTGQGQVVGIADTGLDVTSCYFADQSGSVPPSLYTSPVFDRWALS